MNRTILRTVEKVKQQRGKMAELDDSSLKAKTGEFKERLRKGESLDHLLPEAFAVICEADRRVLGMQPFDVQIMGAVALHKCHQVEMNTGEGKTLTATMPLYLNALTGKSTILVTANSYLAWRDAKEMGPVYEFLGLTVRSGTGLDPDEQLTNEDKRRNYGADILYTTHGVLGFDYLLNNLVKRAEDRFLRNFYYVIVDEADSVLLDAAAMPLVISGSPRVQSNLYKTADFFVTTLEEDQDYEMEDKAVWLTEQGVRKAERFFGISSYYSAESFEINRHVTLALRARKLMVKEKDYLVSREGEVLLLDGSSGRSMKGVRLRGGQHQAIETKEGVRITQEQRSVASVTYQNLFRMFPRMAGMSGTIADARRELHRVYHSRVTVIPPHKPMRRTDLPDLYFASAEDQYDAVTSEIIARHRKGQPVLVITSTIDDTELIAKVLVKEGIPHSVLNANNAYWEAQIIREAGRKGAVTVATSMAGRGTDIRLGTGVSELGGLAVLGVGRMQNVRLERQARGRAGRQGDPGTSQFFVCLEDEIASVIGEKKLEKYADRKARITSRKLRRMINGAQKASEENEAAARERAVQFDEVMKRQRDMFYAVRNRLLDGGSLEKEEIFRMQRNAIHSWLHSVKNVTLQEVVRYMLDHMTYRLEGSSILTLCDGPERVDKGKLETALAEYAAELYEKKQIKLGSEEAMREFVRLSALQALDEAWVEEVDYLQQLTAVVSGRSFAQRNPLFEYQKEAYRAFERMQDDMQAAICRNILLSGVEFDEEGKMQIVFP